MQMIESQLISIQVGAVKTHILDNGDEWTTAYEKLPVTGEVFVGEKLIEGDDQHHKKVHGGTYRAGLMYSADHYPEWTQQIGRELHYGAFGGNFTVSHYKESNVCLGDIFQIGDTVRLQISQPRQPCDQIGMYLKIPNMRNLVDESQRTGWYVRVLQTGYTCAGMPIAIIERPYPEWELHYVQNILKNRKTMLDDVRKLVTCDALRPSLKNRLKMLI